MILVDPRTTDTDPNCIFILNPWVQEVIAPENLSNPGRQIRSEKN